MAESHQHMMRALDNLIKKAPDIDIDKEFGAFLKEYEKELKDSCDEHIEGLVPRLIFLLDFARFQTNIMLGGELKDSLQSLLIWAEKLDHGDVPVNFSNETRMNKMAEILRKKAETISPTRANYNKRWAQPR
ncbi:MAG: hypothetical protein SNF33_02550 [Candidatus Algichlamydia australiensis]|nr:hypothetical protein [Chlamydiales bacterium]